MSVPELRHYGHGELAGPASLYYISRHRRTVSLGFQSSGGVARLPAANRMPGTGPDLFRIFNVGGDDFSVADHTGTLVGTVPAGQMGLVDLSNNGSEAGTWHMQVSGYAAPTSTPPSTSVSVSVSVSIPTDPTEGDNPPLGSGTNIDGTQPSGMQGGPF